MKYSLSNFPRHVPDTIWGHSQSAPRPSGASQAPGPKPRLDMKHPETPLSNEGVHLGSPRLQPLQQPLPGVNSDTHICNLAPLRCWQVPPPSVNILPEQSPTSLRPRLEQNSDEDPHHFPPEHSPIGSDSTVPSPSHSDPFYYVSAYLQGVAVPRRELA